MNLVIFGAQAMALSVYEAIKTLYPKKVVKNFLVTSIGSNPTSLCGIPVIELNTFSERMSESEKNDTEILIATPESVHKEIEDSLRNKGFHCYVSMDSKRFSDLMKLYHTKLGKFLPLSSLPIGYHKACLTAFAAKSHKDYKICNDHEIPDYIIYVQAGADLCERRIAELADNSGRNISKRNGNYCELTVLYWLWKNCLGESSDACEYTIEDREIHDNTDTNTDTSTSGDAQYYGLVQYRRILNFDEDDLFRLKDNDVDVILPYPMSYEPDINVHHERYLRKEDWSVLMEALQELQPEYVKDFENILNQKYLYNYNIIIAKKQVIVDYCEWLFPILNRVEELSIPKGSERADRYIGYMGETLETLYFIRNRDRLNIAHTGYRFLS